MRSVVVSGKCDGAVALRARMGNEAGGLFQSDGEVIGSDEPSLTTPQ